MKAAVIEAPPRPPASSHPLDRLIADQLNNQYEPVRRMIADAPDRDVRWGVLTIYEACAGWQCFEDVWRSFRMSDAELHRRLGEAGFARIKANPWGYVELSVSEYVRMWLLHQRKHPDIAPRFNAYLESHAPVPFMDEAGPEARPIPAAEQRSILRVNRAVFAMVGILAALMTIAFAFWRRDGFSRTAFCLLLATQGVLMLSALLGAGLVRYALAMWPTLIAAEILGFAALLALWKPGLFDSPGKASAAANQPLRSN